MISSHHPLSPLTDWLEEETILTLLEHLSHLKLEELEVFLADVETIHEYIIQSQSKVS